MKIQQQIKSLLLLSLLLVVSCKAATLRKDNAADQIAALKDGYLLVRLKTQASKIEHLESIGDKAGAKKLKKDQDALNRRIIDAFAENFTFCPVYFFSSEYSAEVKEGNREYVFSSRDKHLDAALFEGKFYMVGEFGFIEDESETGVVPGFKVMDENYEQIGRPFPFGYPTTWRTNPKTLEVDVANGMDSKFETFLISTQIRAKKRALKRKKKALLQELKEEEG